MRKTLILVLILVFRLPGLAFADGISDQQFSQGVKDYRAFTARTDGQVDKPLASFKVSVINAADEATTVSPESPTGFDVSAQETMVAAHVGDVLSFIDCSSPSDGNNLNLWDFQYKYLDLAQDPASLATTAQYFSNATDVNLAMRSIKLNKPGQIRFYLSVQDSAPTYPDAGNWSANGNLRVEKSDDPAFPNGMYWYFTEVFVNVLPSPGIDIAISLEPDQAAWTIHQGQETTPSATATVWRNDSGADTIQATLETTTPDGTKTKTIELPAGARKNYSLWFNTGSGGIYDMSANVTPIGVTDIDTNNNSASTKVKVTDQNDAYTGGSGKGTRVGLGG